ncbi:hypothetical protein [Actinoplanes flavus]|uniref:Uncharacterized protein n=1 Tax=Actinoplanes flavus TaxID=2820290 RepID=A0ABS3UY61_9ACTN|nr:hypothetical protein [Actinoplanes flavus]MBO3743518.1 hypothetical protein [Actinoplanes flavus]
MDHDLRRRRLSAGVLGIWYGAALFGPVVAGTLWLGTGFLERHETDPACDDPLECGNWFPDAGEVLGLTAVLVLPGLLISVPLWFWLVRRLRSAVLAGTLAAFGGGLPVALLACRFAGVLG